MAGLSEPGGLEQRELQPLHRRARGIQVGLRARQVRVPGAQRRPQPHNLHRGSGRRVPGRVGGRRQPLPRTRKVGLQRRRIVQRRGQL